MITFFLNFLLITSLTFGNTPKSVSSTKKTQSKSIVSSSVEPIPFEVKEINSDDLAFGKKLVEIFTDLTKNAFKSSDAVELKSLLKKARSFNELSSTVDRLNELSKISTYDDFYDKCIIAINQVDYYTENINDRLNISIDKHCRFLFFKRLTKLSPNSNLSSRDIVYLKETLKFIADGENINNVALLLMHFNENVDEYERLSNIFIDYYVANKIRPPSQILTNLKSNPKLHSFIQSNLNLEEGSTKVFQDEFQRSLKDANEAIDRGDLNLAKTLAYSAQTFYNRNKDYISNKKAFVHFVILAKAFYFKNREGMAQEIFEIARNLAPKDEFSEANFYLLWTQIVSGDYETMKKNILKYGFDKDFDKFDSKLQYWIALSFEKNGDTKKAQSLFGKVVSNSPYSFYSIMALKEIAVKNKGKLSEYEILSKLISIDPPVDFKFDSYSDTLKSALRRFAIWDKIGNERFITLEIRNIQSIKKEDLLSDSVVSKTFTKQTHSDFLTLNLVKLVSAKKKHLTSFRIFQESLDVNSLLLNFRLIKYVFPLNYFDIIKKNALNLDPLIIISLIRQESAFNPEATSSVGAKGLMQLMLPTAKRFNKKVKIKHLSNPEINVAIGSKYLRLLISRYEGNLIYALASYNAGESRVDRWKRDILKNDDPLSTIETIPFEETRNYVKLIYRNYFFYNLLQEKSILMTPIKDSFIVQN